jgi:hypothetical protein
VADQAQPFAFGITPDETRVSKNMVASWPHHRRASREALRVEQRTLPEPFWRSVAPEKLPATCWL